MAITLYTHFIGNINLPNTSPDIAEGEALAVSIAKYEPQFLTNVLGFALYELFLANIDEGSGVYHDLLVGADFTDKLGRANHWQGLNNAGFNPIANFIYYKVMNEKFSNTMGIGERRANAENMGNGSPLSKMVSAWNEMVEWLWIMDDFLRQNSTDYPDYIGIDYPPFDKSYYPSNTAVNEAANNQYFQLKNPMF